MGIWLILTGWMVSAGVFVLAICSAAARPIPQPVGANVEENKLSGCEGEKKTPDANIFHPVLWLIIALAVFTTSCVTIPPGSRPLYLGRGEPVKGATLLMQR